MSQPADVNTQSSVGMFHFYDVLYIALCASVVLVITSMEEGNVFTVVGLELGIPADKYISWFCGVWFVQMFSCSVLCAQVNNIVVC